MRSSRGRPRLSPVVAALLLALAAGPAAAQTAGKVQGRVVDAQTGQPVAGAQVVVVGTRIGNLTNTDGFYFINNVPAGVHDIQAQFIGYQPVTVSGQRVLANYTTTVDFRLSQQAVALEAITVQGESNPLVPRDKTVSAAIVTGDVVEALPVDNVRAVVTLQPGVVEYGDDRGQVIRGGRPGEASVYVDGVLVRNFNTGSQSILDIGVNAVEQVNVLTGGYGAEYGQAQSGIINYVTKTGGTRYGGALSFGTDQVMPNSVRYGISRLEASLSGPLLRDRLSFNLAMTAEGQEENSQQYRDLLAADSIPNQTRWFRPTGLAPITDAAGNALRGPDGQPVESMQYEEIGGLGPRRPYSNQDLLTLNAGLRFNLTDDTRLSATIARSRNQGLNFLTAWQFRPKGIPAFLNQSELYRVGLEQILFQSAARQATLRINAAYGNDRLTTGQRADTVALEPEGPDFLGFRFRSYDFLYDAFTVDRYFARFDSIRAGLATSPLVPVELLGLSPAQGNALFNPAQTSENPYGIPLFNTSGLYGYQHAAEKTWSLDIDLDFQANRVHRLGAGIELYRKEVDNIGGTNPIPGFLNPISTYATIFQNIYRVRPTIGALWIKDRMDIGEMVIDAGVRFDVYDSDARFPEVPGLVYPYIANDGSQATPELIEQQRIWSWSPRLGVAFPISDATSFRLSYGHFFQLPQFSILYNSINTDISQTNSNTAFGRPIEAMKAVQFEAGVSHMFNPFTVLDLTAYNKDKLADGTYRIARVPWPKSRGDVADGRILTALDFGNIRGFDLRLTRRLSYLTAILGYGFLDSKGTGSDPTDFINSFGRFTDPTTGAPLSPAQALQPTDFDQRHKFTLAVTASFPQDVGEGTFWNAVLARSNLAVTTNVGSGLPFTRSSTPAALGRGTGGNATGGSRFTELINASRMPWNSNVDGRFTRGFRLGGGELSAFLDVRNVLDTRNIVNVFSINGDPTDPGDIPQQAASYSTSADVRLSAVTDPTTYLRYSREQQMLQRYGFDIGDPDVFTVAEQHRAASLAYIASNIVHANFGQPRRFRVGLELIF